MRILYFSASAVPSRAANSVHVMKMCQALANNGHSVVLHAWSGHAENEDDFELYGVQRNFDLVKHPRSPVRGTSALLYAWKAARLLRDSSPDLLYGRSLLVLATLARQGIPVVYEAHNPPATRVQHQLCRHLFRSRSFTRLVVISTALAAEYRRRFPDLGVEQITVAHDGADPPPERAAAGVEISPWPGRTGCLQAGYVGHLYAGRGIDLIISLAAALPEIDFHLVGGTEADLDRWRRSVGPNSCNLYFHGFVSHGQLQGYFDRFDVLLAPYQEQVSVVGGRKNTVRWMSPLKIFEYMAQGKPILCSDLPALREILDDGTSALMLPPSDVASWANALRELHTDSGLRRSLGEAAYSVFTSEYTWKRRAERVIPP